MRVTYGQSAHGEDEIEACLKVLRSSTQMGDNVAEFERDVAGLLGKDYGVMVNSGSSANLLALKVLDLKPGAEIITPVLTFATTVAPMVQLGLVPHFVDVEEGTYCIDLEGIEPAIRSSLPQAMMIPNLIGNLPKWPDILKLAAIWNIHTIEDSCDTLGALRGGFPPAQHADISTTSFYGSHIINCAGNGGLVAFNDKDLMREARVLRSWGRTSSIFGALDETVNRRFETCDPVDGIDYDAKFIFSRIGYNFEPSEIGAAFGLVQLRKLEEFRAKRKANFQAHYAFFKDYEQFFILPSERGDTAWLAFPLTIRDDAPFTRKQLQIYFEQRDIQTRVIFTGNILRQPAFKDIAHKGSGSYPNADRVMRGGFLIGLHQGLTDEHLAYVHQVFRDFVKTV